MCHIKLISLLCFYKVMFCKNLQKFYDSKQAYLFFFLFCFSFFLFFFLHMFYKYGKNTLEGNCPVIILKVIHKQLG